MYVCWHVVCVLRRRSYALHAELAQRFGRDTIGYREVDTIQVGIFFIITACCMYVKAYSNCSSPVRAEVWMCLAVPLTPHHLP